MYVVLHVHVCCFTCTCTLYLQLDESVPLNGVDPDDVKEIYIQRFLETSNISGIIISAIQICIDLPNYTPHRLQLYHRVIQLL